MKVKVLKNIRYKNTSYVVGEIIELTKSDIDSIGETDVIEILGSNNEVIEDEYDNEVISRYDDMTKKELMFELDRHGVEYSERDSKVKLLKKYEGVVND